jgi:hypothetical protein
MKEKSSWTQITIWFLQDSFGIRKEVLQADNCGFWVHPLWILFSSVGKDGSRQSLDSEWVGSFGP